MSEVKQKTLISLGMSCQTAHQLRRLTNPVQDKMPASKLLVAPSGLFDWLICPPASTINLLNERIPDFTKKDIHLQKGRAYWTEFNLYFWHSFITDRENLRVSIDETFERELTRWRYLRDRFSALDPAQTVFVISNTQNNLATEVFDQSELDHYHFTAPLLDELTQSLAMYFDTTTNNIQLEVLTRNERAAGLVDHEFVTFLPLDHNEWKGSNNSWDQWWQQLGNS